jgi:putative pyruvate formate lyase activating enzyme
MKSPENMKPIYSRRRFFKKAFGISLTLLAVNSFVSLLFSQNSHPMKKLMNSEKQTNPANQNGSFTSAFEPGYLKLHRSGELKRRGEILWQKMNICDLCPRECETHRLDGQRGDCEANAELEIASFHPHFGEEAPLVMDGGSGTIFFSNCSLRCVYCINWQVSIKGEGDRKSIEELAQMMLRLQQMGCENINVVTPTHYTPHIVKALDIAAEKGLTLPLVYNTSGYEKQETLKLLDGIVDIYLPDFKYFESAMAAKYSNGARTYPEMAKAALIEMNRQVGVARPGNGKAYRGLMIRHLVLPNGVSGTKDILTWISGNLPKDTYINLMSQYSPYHKAREYPQLARRITYQEYNEAITHAKKVGLTNIEVQGV